MPHSVLPAAIVCLLLTSCLVDADQDRDQDLTRKKESTGTDVVEASVALVEESAIFPNDNQFLRRLAWVESEDGERSDTYRSGYFGGIWQVDETVLLATQDVANNPKLTGVFNSLQVQFNIDWLSVRKEDLLEPLFSALAANIFITMSIVSDPIPLASDIRGQGRYWQNHYRPNETVDTFVQRVQELQSLQGEKSETMCVVLATPIY